MRDVEKHDSAELNAQVCAVEGLFRAEPVEPIKQFDGGLVCGDADTDLRPGCDRELLIDGGSETIPFYASFFDNLGPRYQAQLDSDGLRFAWTSPAERQVLSKSHPDFDSCIKSHENSFTDLTGPKPNNAIQTQSGDAAANNPESSRRAVQDQMTEPLYSEEVTSACKSLIVRSSGNCTGGLLKGNLPSAPSETETSGRRINFDGSEEDNGLQFRCTPPSSTGSSTAFDNSSHQLSKKTLRDLLGKGKEHVEDHGLSLSFTRKRLWLDMGSQDCPRSTSAEHLSSRRDDVDEIFCAIHAAKCRSAERGLRLRMLLSPVGPVRRRSKEAMDLHVRLESWHCLLGLDNPACPTIASHIFFRAFRLFQRSTWPKQMLVEIHDQFRVRVLMATALWVAVKLVDKLQKTPKASRMASTAGITARSLLRAEIPLLDALEWRLLRY